MAQCLQISVCGDFIEQNYCESWESAVFDWNESCKEWDLFSKFYGFQWGWLCDNAMGVGIWKNRMQEGYDYVK